MISAANFEHRPIMNSPKRRTEFEARLLNSVKEILEDLIAWVVLPNHYHFLLRQNDDIALNIPIAYIFNAYTKAINKSYNRTGTLFEGPFKSIEVEDVNYLKQLCRYIHRNPVDDGLVEKIEDWEFSNYPEWVGKRNGTLVDLKFRDRHFKDANNYESYVKDHISIKQAIKGLTKYLLELKKIKK